MLAGKKSKLAEMMAIMCNPARMVKLELAFAISYACCGGWHHAKLGWHVEGSRGSKAFSSSAFQLRLAIG